MKLRKHKIVDSPNGPARIVYVTNDGKAVIRRINTNHKNEFSGTEFFPVRLLKEYKK